MSNIQQALQKNFEQHRIIFWYDEKEEFRQDYEEFALAGVEKEQAAHNEFYLKYLVTKQHPQKKFLLYFPYPQPTDAENWLLDLELMYYTFHTEREAIYLQEMGLSYHYKELVSQHILFFYAKERRQKLSNLITNQQASFNELKNLMLCIVLGSSPNKLTQCIFAHTQAFLNNNDKPNKELQRFNLWNYYWQSIQEKYQYQSNNPSIYDFLIEVFTQEFSELTASQVEAPSTTQTAQPINTSPKLNADIKLLLNDWKDSKTYRQVLENISNKIANDIQVANTLTDKSLAQLMSSDLFEQIDKEIIRTLVSQIIAENTSNSEIQNHIKQRSNTFWYSNLSNYYECIRYAAAMIEQVRTPKNTQPHSFEEGISDYAHNAYKIDYAYRKFIWHYRLGQQKVVLQDLAKKINKVYSNDWLLPYNDNWQKHINTLEKWPFLAERNQRNFYKGHVADFPKKGLRIFVIISDALRYECAEELRKLLQAENRYNAQLQYMVSEVPSYTQVGMSALLPHQQLQIKPSTDNILVDEMPAIGIQGRTKILSKNANARATAIHAKEFMAMNANIDGRAYVKQYDVIYIYSNRIDKRGDDKASEEQVFDAVAEELNYLVEVVKKITNMNGSNIFVTADHGFLYQHHPLETMDFSEATYTGAAWKANRRFVIGEELKGDAATKHFTAEQLGFNNPNVDILFPKSINRLRVKGAGSRFVHGGTSLQEIIVPLLKINKKRADTNSKVSVDVIQKSSSITTNLLVVSFLQKDLVDENTLPITLRAGLYAEKGTTAISNTFTYTFDATSGLERERTQEATFQLSRDAGTRYRNQQVQLILEAPLEGTNKWVLYNSFTYIIRTSGGTDFDF